ncbi:MAG: cysteine desulfurase CsdA [Bacteroidetes bacterium SW_10_40_5]|nr:MAG: cysteine desulfurase CsdA [Bacteroidetes bacterium SW_10_40_5]
MVQSADIGDKTANLDVSTIRKDFPILFQEVNGNPLVYLDNAATTQKPKQVIDTVADYYSETNSNVHRGIHRLSDEASQQYEAVRETVQQFLNASKKEEIVFTRGTTESINLVAQTFGKTRVREGDEVLITAMEHHSNIVPWQMLCEQQGATLKVLPINDKGELKTDDLDQYLTSKTKLFAFVQVSNTLGTVNPAHWLIQKAHANGTPVLADAAQVPMHQPVDVQDLDCDFWVFSGHKIFGPTGIGVLYGKEEHLEAMPPYQGGGDMIDTVTFEKTTYNEIPLKFEAGTPNIAGTIGLGEALRYVQSIGLSNIQQYETELLEYATEQMQQIKDLKIIGTADNKCSVISFHFNDIHPQDMGILLDKQGIAIRTGHHCTQPLMERFQIPATSRASFALYNTKEEVDKLVKGIHQVKNIFGS